MNENEDENPQKQGSGGVFFFCLWYIFAWIVASIYAGTKGFTFFLVPFVLIRIYIAVDKLGEKL